MRDFCSDPLWDLNLTWYTDEPDFTRCFQSTVLVYVPCAIVYLGMVIKWHTWKNSKGRDIPWTPTLMGKILFSGILMLICGIQLIMELVYLEEDRPTAFILAPLVYLLTFSLVLYLDILDRKKGISSSGVQFMFWFLGSIASTFTFTSYVRFPYLYYDGERALYLVFYALMVTQMFLASWASPPPKYVEFKGTTTYTQISYSIRLFTMYHDLVRVSLNMQSFS